MPHVGHENIQSSEVSQLGTELPDKACVYQGAPIKLRECFQHRDFTPGCSAEFGIDQVCFSNAPGSIAHPPSKCPAGDGRPADRIYIRSQSERARNRLPPKLFREARVPDKITAKTSIGLGVVQHFCAGQDALKIHTDQQMKRTAKADLFGRDVRRGKH